MALMEYAGFLASVEYDPELDSFMGSVLNLPSPITFYGKTTEELHQEFSNSIQEWLAVCRERGIMPEKPGSSSLTIQLAPALHEEIATAAAKSGKTLNAWVVDGLKALAK